MDRRDFIRTGAGAFFIAATGRAFGAGSASNRLRFALVGCHEKGRGFAVMKKALANPGLEIACVCDVDARAMDFCADWLVRNGHPAPRKEKDFRKVLEMTDVDGVISETPDHFHAWSAIMAMRAGKHVYVEKPCAFCPAEAELLLETWKKTGLCLQVGSQRRSAPSVINAIAAIRGGDLIGRPKWGKAWYMTKRKPIGKGVVTAVPEWLDWDLWQGPAPRQSFRDNIVHYNWHWFRNWGTGECGNNSVHFVDLARWCLGAEAHPKRVTSGGGRFWIPADTDWEWPDTQNVTWEYADGKCITWEGLSCENRKPFMNVSTGALVYGDKGVAFFAPGGDAEVFDEKGKSIMRWDAKTGGAPKLTNTDDRSGGGWTDATGEHFGNFMDAIRANDPKRCAANAEIGVKSTSLALVANVAHFTGGALDLDATTGRPVGNAAADRIWSREYAPGWELA